MNTVGDNVVGFLALVMCLGAFIIIISLAARLALFINDEINQRKSLPCKYTIKAAGISRRFKVNEYAIENQWVKFSSNGKTILVPVTSVTYIIERGEE